MCKWWGGEKRKNVPPRFRFGGHTQRTHLWPQNVAPLSLRRLPQPVVPKRVGPFGAQVLFPRARVYHPAQPREKVASVHLAGVLNQVRLAQVAVRGRREQRGVCVEQRCGGGHKIEKVGRYLKVVLQHDHVRVARVKQARQRPAKVLRELVVRFGPRGYRAAAAQRGLHLWVPPVRKRHVGRARRELCAQLRHRGGHGAVVAVLRHVHVRSVVRGQARQHRAQRALEVRRAVVANHEQRARGRGGRGRGLRRGGRRARAPRFARRRR